MIYEPSIDDAKKRFKSDDIVKSCTKLESGMFMGVDGLLACVRGALAAPIFCTKEEIIQGKVTKEFIVERRMRLIEMLNDDTTPMDCKRCLMVTRKRFGDISFSRLGHLDLQNYTMCNLRCKYCNYTRIDSHVRPQYDALAILKLFSPEEVEWDSHVDFAGGEPTLLENLEEYLEFFRSRRIKVLMHTNSVIFHKAIYNGLLDGSIYFVVTSLDAGTPATFRSLRGRDCYLQVLENLCRYAAAGSKEKGMLAVKYIFCDSNCGEDDVSGFAYTMLAIRPQQIWLTFDFTPLSKNQYDYDYSEQIKAYADMYLLLKKHGIEAHSYFKEAIGRFSPEGRKIMDKILATVQKKSGSAPLDEPDLILRDFRRKDNISWKEPDKFSLSPLRLSTVGGEPVRLSLQGKRILLVPSCPASVDLLSYPEIREAAWIGFVDRNPIHHGKSIDGCTIYGYEDIPSTKADMILVVPPEKHRQDILISIYSQNISGINIMEYKDYDRN